MGVVLTREGREQLEERLRRLDEEVLPSLREQLWQPDRDGRIDAALEMALDQRARLASALKAGKIAEEMEDDPQKVEIGDWVSVLGEDGATETFRVVDPVEAPLDSARISYDSPMAQILLGRRVGDEVELRTRFAPPYRYHITGVGRRNAPTPA